MTGSTRATSPRASLLCLAWCALAITFSQSFANAAPAATAQPPTQPPTGAAENSAAPPANTANDQKGDDQTGDAQTTEPASENDDASVSTPPTATNQLPTLDEVDQQIETLQADESLEEPVRDERLNQLKTIRSRIEQIASDKLLQDQLEQAASAAPNQIKTLREKVEAPIALDMAPFTADTSFEELERLKQEADERLRTLNQQLEITQDAIRLRRDESKLLPKSIAELQTNIDQLQNAELDVPEEASAEVARMLQLARGTELAAAKSSLALSQQKQRTYEAESELLALREQQVQRQLEALRERVTELASVLSNQRLAQVDEKLAELDMLLNATDMADDPLTQQITELLKQWPDLIQTLQREEALLVTRKASSLALKDDLNATRGLVETDLKSGRGLSRSVGLLLQRKLAKLPDTDAIEKQQTKVAAEVEDTQEVLTRIETLRDELPSTRVDSETPVTRLQSRQRALLQEMEADAEKLLVDALIPLSVELDQTTDTAVEYKALIEEHMLWVRNQKPLHWSNFSDIGYGIAWLFQWDHGTQLWQATTRSPNQWRLSTFVWLLLGILLWSLRPWFTRRMKSLSENANRQAALHITPTIEAMFATFMLAIPIAAIAAVPGRMFVSLGNDWPFLMIVGDALTKLALLLLPLEFCRQCVRKNGVAVGHFGWPDPIRKMTYRVMGWTECLILPLFFFWRIYAEHVDALPRLSTVSRLCFFAMTVTSSVIVWKALHPRRGLPALIIAAQPGGWLDKLRWLWHPLLTAIPLALGILSLLGYTYSASMLAVRLYRTLWLLTVAGVMLGILLRWVTVSRRKLKLKKLRERNPAPESHTGVEGGGLEWVEDQETNLAVIDQQTRRLIITSIVFVLLLGVYLTWSPVLPALRFLERVTLWPIEAADGSLSYISLADVIAALPIMFLTVILVRNVPGLLETALLQRLPLENAVRYAITTLTSYALAGLGIVLAAGTLGLRWDSIQWLVAGLGVGLGFGLQEIFANFISGIILLFEQPIRVGDIVTLDGTTGVVSRIRMRATTITNWDRQEFVVPNRDFITGRLVNWTLTDATNRVVINVGVAYGSDTRLACQILREVCEANEHVLDDPGPIITFEGFGDSTLNLVLRFYLPNLDNRLGTIHAMHTAIDDRFREANIEIAFPQRDLHLRSVPDQLTPQNLLPNPPSPNDVGPNDVGPNDVGPNPLANAQANPTAGQNPNASS